MIPPIKAPFGCPYHGVVKGGQLTLPNGSIMDYPQQSSSIDEEDNRCLEIAPSWAPGSYPLTFEEQAAQLAKGVRWDNYAHIIGGNSQLHGTELGQDKWLWAEAPGKVWLVDPSELIALDPTTAGGSTVNFHLTRFGYFGTLPDGELAEKTVSVTLPADLGQGDPYANLSGRYISGYWIPYSGRLLNSVSFRLQDTKRSNGSQAIFGAVCTQATARAQQYNVVGVFVVDLAAETFTVLGTRADLYVKNDPVINDSNTFTRVDVQLTRVSVSGGTDCTDLVETYEYQDSPNQSGSGPHFRGSRSYSQRGVSKIMLGAAFDANDMAQLVWARVDETVTLNYQATLTYAGQTIVTTTFTSDGSGGCTQTGKTTQPGATATTSMDRNEYKTSKVDLLIGNQVLATTSCSGQALNHYDCFTDATGTIQNLSWTNDETGWDGTTRSASGTLSGPDAGNFSQGVYADYGWGPLLEYEDWWAGSGIIGESDTTYTWLDPFCLGPGVFCFRVLFPSPGVDQPDGSILIRGLATYQNFCVSRGDLGLAPISRNESRTFYPSGNYSVVSSNPVYAAGIPTGDKISGDSPVAVV